MQGRTIHVIGAGALGLQTVDILLSTGFLGEVRVYDDNNEHWGRELLPGIIVTGGTALVAALVPGSEVVIAIANPAARRRVHAGLLGKGFEFPKAIHPGAVISPFARLGSGCIVFPGVAIDPDARVGNFVVINKNSSIGHNSVLADFVTITPNCTLGCPIGSGAFIGMGARLLPGASVGENSIIGAGAVVNKAIPADVTAVGIPAQIRQ